MEYTITNAELILMRLLWRESPLTAREITQKLYSETQWHRKTVNTLLSRLEKKSVLRAHKEDDGINNYSPQVGEATYIRAATSSFVDRLFDGNITPLIASFAKGRSLDARQLAELRGLLEELSDDD